MMKNKTGQMLGGLQSYATGLIVAAMVIGIGATILFNIEDQQGQSFCTGHWNSSSQVCQINSTNTSEKLNLTTAYNATASGLSAINSFASQLSTLALILVFSVILFFLGRYLVNRK